jgi:hypothetical protein
MAVITPNTTYPNGAALSVPNHNANVYATASGRGIMSEPNGGLQVVNLDAAFTIRDEHIMPEEAVVARMDGSTVPMDVYNNAFGIRDDDDPTYVPLAGLGERLYIPYAMTAVVWQWALHISVVRPWINDPEEQSGPELANMGIRVFIDGVEQPTYRRTFPTTLSLTGTPGLDMAFKDYEHTSQLWYDFALLQNNVAAGFHELTVKLYLPRVTYGSEEVLFFTPMSSFTGTFDPPSTDTVECTMHTRISFGTRSVRCVMFK